MLSIIKRRGALGLLAHSDQEERFTRTRSEIEAGIAIALGGLVAEEMFFGESGTGPGADLAHATTLAAQMVGAFGMAGSLISYEAVADGPLARSNIVRRCCEHRRQATRRRTSSRPNGSGSAPCSRRTATCRTRFVTR